MIIEISNTIGDFGILIDGSGNKIKWDYVVKLHELQKREGFHLGNKLKEEHIEFTKNKMKVRLATQVLSRSVAKSLLVCQDMKMPDFKEAHVLIQSLIS